MRESLTIAAILLIVVLTTALVGPYFVDWNAHRGEIEARLSELLGGRVTIAGPIDVKLLPRPIFKLQQVRIAGTAPGAGTVSAERVDVELAVTALLRGEIRFVDADLTRPHITLRAADDHSIMLPRLGGTNPDRVSVGHIAIHDGTLTLARTGKDDVALTGLEGDGEAESLTGPFKFAGHLDMPRGPLTLHVATGAFQGGTLRVKSTLDPVAGSPKTDLEGMVTMASGSGGGSALSFDGSVSATGEIPLPGRPAVIPWRLATTVHAEAGRVVASALELRAGAEERALVATGEGQFGPDMRAPARVVLRARQIDVGKIAVPAGEGGSQPRPDDAQADGGLTVADDVSALKAFAQNADAFAAMPVPVTLDFGADTVTFGAQTLTGFSGVVTLAAATPAKGMVSLEAADGTRVKLDGSFEPGPAAVFNGRIEASSRDLGRFADSIEADLPESADWLRRTIPSKVFAFAGSVDLSGVGFATHEATLALDRSRFAGTLTLTRSVGADRARLFADLTSDALDIDALPDWRGAADAASNLDLALTVSARAVRLARTDLGTVEAGRIALQLNKAGSAVTLERLSVADLGGATAAFTGRSDGSTAHITGRFDARKLHDLASLLQRIVPNATTRFLSARADVLSPALFKVAADAAVNDDGSLTPTALSVDGTAAGTAVALHLRPDPVPRGQADDPLAPFRSARAPITATLSLDAPEAGALLRQIGLATLPATAIGHGRIEANARVGGSNTLDGALTAMLGDNALTFKGHGSLGGDATGHLSLHGPNVAPVLRAITLAVPEAGATWPLEAEGDITLRDRRISTRGLTGRIVGTRFGGDLSFVLPPLASDEAASPPSLAATEPPALTGALSMDQLPLAILTGLALGPLPQPKSGAVWPDSPFAPGFLNLPRAELSLTAADFPLSESTAARNARMTLRLAPGVVTLADLSAGVGADGRLGANVTLRRDGGAASLSGHVEWTGVPLATPSLAGRSRGSLDLAGTGASAAGMMAGLAGNGTFGIDDARLPRFDPAAIARVAASTDAATDSIDPGEIAQAVDRELDRAALTLGDLTVPVTIAAGVLRSDIVKIESPTVASQTTGSLDLKTLQISLRTTATLLLRPKDWIGRAPQVSIEWKGPLKAPTRQIDAAELVNGIAARAIARDQARIDAFQDDVRERAFFARRLKAIEAEQAAKAAQAKAEADRQKAEADLQKALQPLQPSADLATKSLPRPVGSPTDGRPSPLIKPPDAPRLTGVKPGAPGALPGTPLPVPVQRSGTRPNPAQKPIDLQRAMQPIAPPALPPSIPSILADPGSAGRY